MTSFSEKFLARQSTLIPANVLNKQINVIGAGAIGSHTVMALTRMGCSNITVWDYDEVDHENMNNQGYKISDIGKLKVVCLANKVQETMGFTLQVRPAKWTNQPLLGIVIAAVDNMETRKQLWAKNNLMSYMIDPRMGAEYAKMYVMEKESVKDGNAYRKTLYTDEEAVREACTAKSTIYTALLLSGMVCKAVKDILLMQPYTRVVEWDIAKNKMMSWNNREA